jgi:hypothetical protein
LFARDLPASAGSARAVQRVAAAAPGARIQALLSDDNRAIVAWTDTRGGTTSVYYELTAVGVRFGAPRLLERFADPRGAAPARGSLRLVRLASESVMLAWSGAAAGHWVVHTAAVDLHGVRSIATISSPGRDALLADLAPGPDKEAYAVWSEAGATGGGREPGGRALYSARGNDAHPDRTIFAAPEAIAASGPQGRRAKRRSASTPAQTGRSSPARSTTPCARSEAVDACGNARGAVIRTAAGRSKTRSRR